MVRSVSPLKHMLISWFGKGFESAGSIKVICVRVISFQYDGAPDIEKTDEERHEVREEYRTLY
jgi:hypothetical protein